MKAAGEPQGARVAGFRTKLAAAMMLAVSAATLTTLLLAQRRLEQTVEEELQAEFAAELAALERTQEMRHVALLERCRALVRRPRIQQALEEAPDLLYLIARDELQDTVRPPAGDEPGAARGLQAQFYRFLDRSGAPIPPVPVRDEGRLGPEEERALALPRIGLQPQLGYAVRREPDGTEAVSEIIAMPIVSSETRDPIGALVLGFKPYESAARSGGVRKGILLGDRLYAPGLAEAGRTQLAAEARSAGGAPRRIGLDGAPHLLLAKRLNPVSQYPEAHEVCLFPLAHLAERQRQLRWQVLGSGGAVLLLALAASRVVAGRLSAPVERLAVASEAERAQRQRAEAALETTSAELQRSARFSADASHQLKTPVAVLRAGLEELLARETLTPAECERIAALVHQTYRLSSVIEDLLLLSRMDAGRLQLALVPVDLAQLIEASLDDLGALPDGPGLAVETDFPPALSVLGEKRYTAIVLQNLLENARKYNRDGGRIRLTARAAGGSVRLAVANTGRPIPPETQARIFERFHRGGIGENVPGYGLGLNLARELARLHGGDLRLARSDEAWTEFEVTFRPAAAAAGGGGAA